MGHVWTPSARKAADAMESHMEGTEESSLPSPAWSPTSPSRLNAIQTTTNIYNLDFNMLSPPITPTKQPAMEPRALPRIIFPLTPRASLEERPAMLWAITKPKLFSGRYRVDRPIGAGAWSTVYAAEEIRDPSEQLDAGRLTPPPSPNFKPRANLYAVKTPNQKAARRVLTREARVLTFLHGDSSAEQHVVGFHGQNPENDALVLDYAPLILSRFIRNCTDELKFSTSTMYDPIIGEAAWKDLARQLIGGLEWLHSRGVVHGDIKADNILMRRRVMSPDGADSEGFPCAYEPLFCDFSSALIDEEEPSDREVADDAITTTYASPELLESFRWVSKKFEKEVDRRKADVWATAVVLVFAATGGEPYAEARMSMQRTMMAKHGDVLGSVRGGSQATRIMKGQFVAKTVAPALNLDPKARVGPTEWLEKLQF